MEEYDICWEAKAGHKFKEIYAYLKINFSEKTAKRFRDEVGIKCCRDSKSTA